MLLSDRIPDDLRQFGLGLENAQSLLTVDRNMQSLDAICRHQ